MIELRGLTWNHPRGLNALRAASAHFTQMFPQVTVRWRARSLAEFENVPLRDLAPSCDLVAIDHPFVGKVDADGSLVPLDELLPAEVLDEQAANSVGPSYPSYTWNGHQWGLPVDVAAQVAAWRPDLLERDGLAVPSDLTEVTELAKSLLPNAAMALPANATHMFSSLLTICQLYAEDRTRQNDLRPAWWTREGLDPEVAAPALEELYRIISLALPESLDQNPIQVLDAMSRRDDIVYVPFVFGYANYARAGFAPSVVRFGAVPARDGRPPGSVLGGVGLAVSASSRHREAAVAFTRYVTSADCQRGAYFEGGGQPGHRLAWLDAAINDATGNFFEATLETLDNACVRPRFASYPGYQLQAGPLLRQLVRREEPASKVIAALNELWRRVTTGDPATERSP